MTKRKNPNHPKKGSSTKVEPIKDLNAIATIKAFLRDKPRDYCLFVLGINTALRACELVSLTIGQVAHCKEGDLLPLKQSKNSKHRTLTLNAQAVDSIHYWLAAYPKHLYHPDSPLFLSKKGKGQSLAKGTLSKMVKAWCAAAGLHGNYASHSLRKSWGYHQRVMCNMATPILMEIYGHASERETLNYLCIQPEEIQAVYLSLEL